MDETEDTKGLSSETPGQASKGGEGTTSKKEAKTYTESEVEKIKSDALAAAGRLDTDLANKKADLDARQEAINARQAEIDEQERQRDAAELAAAKGDPELMRVYQDKQSQKQASASIEAQKADIKRQQAEVDRSKAEHEAEIKAARETMLEVKIWQIATKHKVDPVALKNLNLATAEQIEEVAKVMPKQPGEGETTEELSIDSGVTSGGQGEPTREQLEKMTVAQYAAWVAKRDEKK